MALAAAKTNSKLDSAKLESLLKGERTFTFGPFPSCRFSPRWPFDCSNRSREFLISRRSEPGRSQRSAALPAHKRRDRSQGPRAGHAAAGLPRLLRENGALAQARTRARARRAQAIALPKMVSLPSGRVCGAISFSVSRALSSYVLCVESGLSRVDLLLFDA